MENKEAITLSFTQQKKSNSNVLIIACVVGILGIAAGLGLGFILFSKSTTAPISGITEADLVILRKVHGTLNNFTKNFPSIDDNVTYQLLKGVSNVLAELDKLQKKKITTAVETARKVLSNELNASFKLFKEDTFDNTKMVLKDKSNKMKLLRSMLDYAKGFMTEFVESAFA